MKVLKNDFFRQFHVGPFRDAILEKTDIYEREVPTRFFPKNFHKQRTFARLTPLGVSDSRKDP